MCALPILRVRRTAPFVSSRYTVVCTVVYAGRGSGKPSWISRTEAWPRDHRISRICSSSRASLGNVLVVDQVKRMWDVYGRDRRERQHSSRSYPG